jgi:hypothetical protein
LGVDLQVTKPGSLRVTPLVIVTQWLAAADGSMLSSHVEGHVTTDSHAGVDVPGPNPTADYEVFSCDSDGHGDGYVTLSEELSISIEVVAPDIYQVWFNLVVNGDQSGDDHPGHSVAGGSIEAEIPFFVTHLT